MQSLRVGLAKADITPPVGTMMAGYIRRKQVSQGINDPLFAKVLYLNSGKTKAALVVLDTCLLDQNLLSMARTQVEQATGLPGEHVCIAATHTHSGPSGLGRLSFCSGYNQELLEFVTSQITMAVKRAKEEAFEARLKVGSTLLEGITLNRRAPTKPVDLQLHVLRIEDEIGQLRGVLMNYPCHATFLNYDNLMISADWPGATCSVVERLIGDEVIVLATIGASGDIHPLYLSQTFDDMKRMGQVLGGAVVMMLGHLSASGRTLRSQNIRWGVEVLTKSPYGRLVTDPEIQLLQRRVRLPLKEFLSKEAYDEQIAEMHRELRSLGLDDKALDLIADSQGTPAESEASVKPAEMERKREICACLNMMIGERLERDWALKKAAGREDQEIEFCLLTIDEDLAFLLVPAELSNSIGLSLSRKTGIEDLFVVSCANGYAGYIVPASNYPLGGYEVGVSHFMPEAEAILTEAVVDLALKRAS